MRDASAQAHTISALDKKQITFSKAIENYELMLESYPQTLGMGITRID